MAHKVILKKTFIPGKAPQTADLQYGELAINYADGTLYYKRTDNTIQSLTGSVGYTGSAGSIGYTGSQGVGYTGSRGYTGSQGYTGSKGTDGVNGYTGSQGYTGSIGYTGSQGIPGEYAGLGYTGSRGYTGSQGNVGYTGSKGTDGTSVTIKGSASSSATLPNPYNGSTGDGYLTSNNGHLHVWSGSSWIDVGVIQGPRGYTGSAGVGGGGAANFGNLDGGLPNSNYGGIQSIDAGGVTA